MVKGAGHGIVVVPLEKPEELEQKKNENGTLQSDGRAAARFERG